MNVNFRTASGADLDLLVGFIRQFYAIDQYPFDERVVRAALGRLLGDASLGRVWLIDREEVSIGYLILTFGYSIEFHGRDAFLDEFFIEAGHRHQGVGAQAMQFVEAACRELGVHALHLEVERENIAGQALYRKSGFIDHDRYLMTKWLARESAP